MKSKIKGILLVALAFSFTMVACGNQGKNNNTVYRFKKRVNKSRKWGIYNSESE